MKEQIIARFNQNVKGRSPDLSNTNIRHDGREGYWLETQMQLTHNGNNAPDLFGYEMKNQTTSGKISFGDWSADEYIYVKGRGARGINATNQNFMLTRNQFLQIFGKPNPLKDDRLSWSGIPCPTYYNQVTLYGQKLTIDDNQDIVITYSFSRDTRLDKHTLVPPNMQIDDLIIAKWYRNSIRAKLERKFNQSGWFTCTKDNNGIYDAIHFGLPMNYESWIELFKQRIIFFDSGMYDGNSRPYSQWRASTGFWHSLIQESY